MHRWEYCGLQNLVKECVMRAMIGSGIKIQLNGKEGTGFSAGDD